MAKKIGLPFWKIGENSFGSTLSYLVYLSKFGEVIPLMPKHSLRKDLDLLVLPGGLDIDPASYGEAPDFYTSKPDPHKEHFDKRFLPKYIELGTPILGICRGHQAISVAFGGKLIQDMHHETNKDTDPYATVHEIAFEEAARNLAINVPETWRLPVNSRHHQAVSRLHLPEELVVLASCVSDGTIEMIAHKKLPIVGVQWHPEDVFNPESYRFCADLIKYLSTTKMSVV